MSFKRYEDSDIVVSTDSVVAPAWSTGNPTLTTFQIDGAQSGVETQYFLNIKNDSGNSSEDFSQFQIAYGNVNGSGSILYNTAVDGKSPSATVYGQFRTLITGDEEKDIFFGTESPDDFYAITIDRSRYKQSLFPGTFNLTLTKGGASINLTDDSVDAATLTFNDAGRVFNVVRGEDGSAVTGGETTSAGTYGLFLPDIGVILLNPAALALSSGNGGINLTTNTNSNTSDNNANELFDAIDAGASFTLNSQENITSNLIFTRVRNAEFNYSTNPSYIDADGNLLYDIWIDSPESYITTIGLYNDNNDLLAVAKLSQPVSKTFTNEVHLRIKLDF